MTPTEYEKAVLEHVRLLFPERYRIKHDVRLAGGKSNRKRQVDIAVYEPDEPKPFLIVEAKRYTRPVSLPIAGSIIAFVQDVSVAHALMVSTAGFTVAAQNHLSSEGIGYIKIGLKEAEALRWIPRLEEKFAVDREFKVASGKLLEALRLDQVEPFLDNEVPYEEWLAVIACGEDHFPEATYKMLAALAKQHHYEGVRYNSVMILIDAGQLGRTDARELAIRESDSEILEILRDHLAD